MLRRLALALVMGALLLGGSAQAALGATLRINLETPLDSVDPAIAFTVPSWQLLYATCAGLMNYPDRPAPEGLLPEPEVAAAMPRISADGKTYTFVVKSSFRFSPPSKEHVTAETFKRALERTAAPSVSALAFGFFARDIVGAAEYHAGTASSISGISAKGNVLTIQLRKPAGDLLARLATPFFCAVPISAPAPSAGTVVPSAGPYYVDSFDRNGVTALKRNPDYHGRRPNFFDEIVYQANVPAATTEAQVIAGDVDYAAEGLPFADYPAINAAYGPGSPAAQDGHQQFFVSPRLGTRFLPLNTSRPLFSNVLLRRAVNYAIDRPAVGLASVGAFGATPTDQLLPPGMPGFHDVDLYPLTGPDLATAQALAAASGQVPATAVLYTCTSNPCTAAAHVIEENLDAIGIDVDVHQFPAPEFFRRVGTRGEPFDIAALAWIADYVDPFDFLNNLLDGNTITDTDNTNFAYFDDPVFNQRLEDAALLQPPARYDAYAALDEDIMRNAAPLVAVGTQNSRDFFSARIGCHLFHPLFGMDLAALCLR